MQDMRLHICENALELFLEQGYDNTALSQVAKACGLTKAGLYHYFGNKEMLLHAVHKLHIEENFAPLLDEIEAIEDPATRLESFVRKYITLMTQDPYARLLIEEVKRLDAAHQEEIRESWRRAYQIVTGCIRELQESGQHKRLDAAFAGLALIGMTTWILYWFDYSRRDSQQELADTFLEIFLNGIRRSPDSSPTPTPGGRS